MERRKLIELTTAMLLVNTMPEMPPPSRLWKYGEPAKAPKDRSKIKAARKQNRSRK